MIWVRVYGGRGRSLFCQEYSRFPGNRSKQSSAAPDFETCSAHTHKQNRMPDEKNIYLKHVHILENVVNICIINDLSYPPATHPQIIRMHFFYYPTRGLSTAPADITAIRASQLRTVRRYQQPGGRKGGGGS